MTKPSRESRINAAFVEIADTLVEDFGVVNMLENLLQKCTQILDVDEGGIMLVDASGTLQVVASTSENADFVELMQVNAGAGPCITCFRTATAVAVTDVEKSDGDWSDFRAAALSRNFRSVHSTPMRLRGETLGTMNLFSTRIGMLSAQDAEVAQALADVATVGILHERNLREANIVTEQLQHALDSRIVIEQAKGVLSHTASIDMDDAFASLRGYARSHNLSVRVVAEGVTARTIDIVADDATLVGKKKGRGLRPDRVHREDQSSG